MGHTNFLLLREKSKINCINDDDHPIHFVSFFFISFCFFFVDSRCVSIGIAAIEFI